MSRWPKHKAWFWETAPFIRVLLPFAAGIFLCDRGLTSGISLSMLLPMGTVAVLFLLYSIFASPKPGAKALGFFVAVQLLFVVAGYTASYVSDIRHSDSWFGNNLDKNSSYLARITDFPQEKESTWKLNIEVVKRIGESNIAPVTGPAFLYLLKDKSPMLLHKGDSILLPGLWTPIQNPGNPFEFDYATYCRRANIGYQQFCTPLQVRLYSTNDQASLSCIARTHDWCMLQLDKYLPDKTVKGLMQAMLLGDEVNLDEDLRQSYTATGIVHVIAISGGNVLLFFLFINFLLRGIKHNKYKGLKYMIALPLVWFYVVMAGASPSAIRAAFMFSLLAYGHAFDKNQNQLNQLFAASFLLLFAQPAWLFSLGFQLSFVAVLSLLIFFGPIQSLFSPKYWLLKKIWYAIAASIAAEILVAPLVVFYFHNFPVMFVVANVIAALLMEVVLVVGIVIIAFSFLPVVASTIGICTIFCVSLFNKAVDYLQHFNPQSFYFLRLSAIELVLVYVVIAGVALFLLRQYKRGLFAGLIACCLLLVSLSIGKWESLHQACFVVYNTGKTPHAESIAHCGFTSLTLADSASRKKINYATNPSHIAWQAWREVAGNNSGTCGINGKRILVLTESIRAKSSFPADIVVVNDQNDMTAEQIKNMFNPGSIVVTGSKNPAHYTRWIDQCQKAGIPLHIVARDGAFVLKAGS